MNMVAPPAATVRTTCPYCGVGCGILARADGQGGAEIAGDPDHPANFGKLCSKGSALSETLSLESRLLYPMLRGADGSLTRTGWNKALDKVASGFMQTIERFGPDSVAFYLSGQLLTEDYYVANKLMKGFIGSANVDTNSRLCMASSVAAHRRAFGADIVPGNYEDLDQADLIVLVGSNTAWCHPILFRRIEENRERRGSKVVVIDPRRTATAQEADLFLPVASGMDAVLFSGLLVHLAESSALDLEYIAAHTDGFDAALKQAREIAPSLAQVAARTGIAESDIRQFYGWFCNTPRSVTCFSQGVNQSAQGTDKANAIINCHLATSRIGRPGMGPFSLTGQPNAMGGREVGGLANQLAAHMGFSPAEIDRVERFWHAPNIARREGLKAVQLFEAIEQGSIKALWVMATNPAVSLPRAGAVAAALSKLDLFVVSENVLSNDTVNSGADILLPAAAWGEKDGTVTNSERRISRQRAFLAAPGEARPDWQIVCDVARRMGYDDAFAFRSAAEIFREHAGLSAFENGGSRDFDIGVYAHVSGEDYDALAPVQWPRPANGSESAGRFFAAGGFFTPNRRARFVAVEMPKLHEDVSAEYSFRLNTGRIRDQWHTMTRTGLSPRLGQHLPEPFVEIHPEDADDVGVVEGGFARLFSAHGEAVYRVKFDDGQQPGMLFAPIHWSLVTASRACTGDLVAPATDPFSGQPEAKATPVAIAPVTLPVAGFMLSRTPIDMPQGVWWTRVTIENGEGVLFASNEDARYWRDFARAATQYDSDAAEYIDEAGGAYRIAAVDDGALSFCLFAGPAERSVQWDAAKAVFAAPTLDTAARAAVLSGKSAKGTQSGPTVCACFGVSLATIREAIESRKACSVGEIGALLRAGTNCGSCKPELKRILSDVRIPETV